MAKAEKGKKVKLAYIGKLENGEIFDKNEEGQYLEFTLGAKELIPGFEAQVLGMELNEKKSFDIAPEFAYGEVKKEMILELPKKEFPKDIKVGNQYEMVNGDPEDHEQHQHIILEIKEIKNDIVVADANHPLAGHTLHFDIELVSVE
ncbi:FKBP-type peptidyl-prolyl cis-trans isomerase [bacterium]|nr:FKBP-type peptidyl-prolyl cis-trans isomerase [bacterium]